MVSEKRDYDDVIEALNAALEAAHQRTQRKKEEWEAARKFEVKLLRDLAALDPARYVVPSSDVYSAMSLAAAARAAILAHGEPMSGADVRIAVFDGGARSKASDPHMAIYKTLVESKGFGQLPDSRWWVDDSYPAGALLDENLKVRAVRELRKRNDRARGTRRAVPVLTRKAGADGK